MEKMQRSKRRRVCSFEPNAVMYAGFAYNYVGHLLPALAKASNDLSSCPGTKYQKMEKTVRFQVDMALVLSVHGFKWSRALKHKLEHGNRKNVLLKSPTCHSIAKSKCNEIVQKLHLQFGPPPAVPRPLALVDAIRPTSVSRMSYNSKTRGGDDEFSRRMRTLRRILPGGSEMCLSELLSEVESYMVCLQLQVNILRTLVEIH